jgi:hypothetical protein
MKNKFWIRKKTMKHEITWRRYSIKKRWKNLYILFIIKNKYELLIIIIIFIKNIYLKKKRVVLKT